MITFVDLNVTCYAAGLRPTNRTLLVLRWVLTLLLFVMDVTRLLNNVLMLDLNLLLTMRRAVLVALLTRRLKVNLAKRTRRSRTLCSLVLFRRKDLCCTTSVRRCLLVKPLNDRLKRGRRRLLLLWKYPFRVLIRWYGVRRRKNPRNLTGLGTLDRC